MPTFNPDDLAQWTGGRWRQRPRGAVCGVCHDTRTLGAGQLYLAIRGERVDGHDYLGQAFAAGAAAAVVEHIPESVADLPLLLVEDTLGALQQMARGHRRRLAGKICSITGSVGKTTVKELTAAILRKEAATAATPGNWNNDIGLPLSMLAMDPVQRFGIFEIAMNRPGEIAALAALLQPDCGIMTTVGLAHSDLFDSVADIAVEKSAMLQALPQDGFAVLSRDEEWYRMFASVTAADIVTVALAGDADFRGCVLDAGHRMRIEGPRLKLELDLPLPGEAFRRNALLATAAASMLGAGPQSIRSAVAEYRPLAMRWELSKIAGVEIINDAYNANPISMRAALKTFAGLECHGRRWMVLAEMGELGSDSPQAHRDIGAIAAGSAERLIAVGRGGAMIADGAVAAGMAPAAIWRSGDPVEAAAILAEQCRAGDAVLLKASRLARLEQVLDNFRMIKERED
jgi:UDP-N-acetylmuramoyl-tripeptide--D-alanyl-D-alanine ligase